jgi:transposase InsO family protein
MLMENFLRSKEYWNLVETGIIAAAEGVDPSEAQQKQIDEQKLKDLKCKNYLFQALDRSILETILKKDTAKDIWDSLKQKYQGTARVKRAQLQALRKEFETLHMKAAESVNDYFGRTLIIANKMRIHGESMKDVVIIEKILQSMTPKYDYVVCSIEESNDLDILSIDELQSSLLVHEQRISRHVVIEEQALQMTYGAQQGGRDGSRNNYRGRGRGRGTGRGRFGFDKTTIECYNCGELGHFQWECPRKTRDQKANYAETREEMLLMAHVSSQQAETKHIWFLDSGCSNHMCGQRDIFSHFDSNFRESVKMGNDSTLLVQGKGRVRMEVNGIIHVITDVFFVPELKTNLLSIGQLQENGLAVLIQQGNCKIFHPEKGLIIETEMTHNRMFVVLADYSQSKDQKCLSSMITDQYTLWHYRYGHFSWNGINILQQKKMVDGLPHFKVIQQVCEGCLAGRQHRDSFPKGSIWRASKILQLVHADICGPITPISNSSKRYLITFIDDFSRKIWVYFLTDKSEAFATFKIYKAKVEKETGAFIQSLRTDRGGEFTSSAFNSFCNENGISKQLTAPYTPQQNGVAERKNQTIMNMVRSMLLEKQIPKSFWPEAVNWAVHVLNRSPTLAVKNKTPAEAWNGIKPSVAHFRVFGCISHVHVPDHRRVKLDAKSLKCVFLGVSENSKAYRLFNPISQKIIISRDVVFEEDQQWNWDDIPKPITAAELAWEATENEDESPIVAESVENESTQSIFQEEPSHVIVATMDENGTAHASVEANSSANSPCAETTIAEGRTRRRPAWLTDYETDHSFFAATDVNMAHLALFTNSDPTTFEEAVKSENWRLAMNQEIAAIKKNETWELTNLRVGGKTVGVKWIFKTKLNELGEVDKYKARLVAKGYSQQYGVDYAEMFAPVARLDTIRMVLSFAAQQSWLIYQLDVKSAFLHGELNEEVFVDQPPGYEQKGEETKVYRLKKALYGLKQAPRAWYSRIESYFSKEGFTKCPYEHTLFIKTTVGGKILIICLYVDDLIFTGNDEVMFDQFKKSMMAEFDMTDLGKMRYFLGI